MHSRLCVCLPVYLCNVILDAFVDRMTSSDYFPIFYNRQKDHFHNSDTKHLFSFQCYSNNSISGKRIIDKERFANN